MAEPIPAPPTEPAPAAQVRQTPPSAEEQGEALASLKQEWQADYAAASQREQKAALAEKLLTKATAPGQQAAAAFVMLDEARRLGAEACETELSLRAADSLSAQFEVEPLSLKLETLKSAAENARFTAQHNAVGLAAEKTRDRALEVDAFEIALKAGEISVGAAQKARDFVRAKDLAHRLKRLQQLAGAWNRTAAARQTLSVDPVDPEANLSLGKFWCFTCGKWDKGLPMLAQGADPQLQKLARDEVAPDRSAQKPRKWPTVRARFHRPLRKMSGPK